MKERDKERERDRDRDRERDTTLPQRLISNPKRKSERIHPEISATPPSNIYDIHMH